MNKIYQNAEDVMSTLPQGKKATLVGGCFDLIHVGHLHLLKYAASLGDLLIVAVLSDDYACGYKNIESPVINEKQRAMIVASIRYVDFVYISDVSPSSPETLKLIRPASVVFGDELRNTPKMQQRMANIARVSPETKVNFLPRYDEEEISTSYIIKKIRASKS